MIEENNQKALLSWISSVEEKDFISFRDLWDGSQFHSLLKKIEDFNVTNFKQYDSEDKQWTNVLANLNRLYKDLFNFYRYGLQKISFDNNFSNTLLIAQNKDSQQIYNFALQVFGAAVQARNRQIFIMPIMGLQSDDQQTLKGLIQRFKFGLGDQSVLKQDDSSSEKKMLLAKVESLEVQNQKLQKQIEVVLQSKKQSQQKYKRLEEEYRKLKQQYQNKLFELDNQPVSEIKVSAHMQELNAVLLEEIKAKLLQQTAIFNRQKAQMLDTIDFLKQKIQKKEEQLQNPDRNGIPIAINPMPAADHPPCISLQRHQELILAQSNKIKQIMKKQMDSSIQNINLKKQIQGLNRQLDKMKNQFIKKSDAINRDDYDAVKLNVLQLLRDKFKSEADKLVKAGEATQ